MANEMSKTQKARVDKMIEGYKDRIARQVQSIDRLLAEREVLKANLAERERRVRELEASLSEREGQKEDENEQSAE